MTPGIVGENESPESIEESGQTIRTGLKTGWLIAKSAQKQEANRDILSVEPTKYLLPREKQYVEPTCKPLTSTTHDHFNPKSVS